MMGGGFLAGENKNTSVSCWRSKQMCSCAEYDKHIQINKVILAYSAAKVYWQNKQKTAFAAEKELKYT